MSEYREALQRLVYSGQEQRCYRCEECNPAQLGKKTERVQCAYHAAKALLARPELEQRTYLHLEGYQLANAYECLGGDFETDVTIAHYDERTDEETGEKMPAGLYLSYTDYPEEGCIFLSPDEPPKISEPAAAEKAREPMHEGFPVDTIVRDIFTDKVGTIVSYHCRFEVEWADGSKSMDVHCRQLDHCGPLPSPPAATGDKCAHDLQLPNHTINVLGPLDAVCKVCKEEWHLPGDKK